MQSEFSQAWSMIMSGNFELLEIILLSLRVSLSATVIATILGLPVAALLVISNFPFRQHVITFCNALLGMPSVVLGLCFYLLLSRAGPLGSLGLLYTPNAMIIAQTTLVFPIIIALSRQVMEPLMRDYNDFFQSLRMRKISICQTLIYESRFALIVVILTAFGRAISEVGAVMVVGGNINHATRVMTTTIGMETNKGNLSLALSLGIILMLIVLSVNITASMLNKLNKTV